MRAINYASVVFFAVLLMIILSVRANADKITVMVVDTGIDANHVLLRSHNITGSKNIDLVDLEGHGTHVASLIINGELTTARQPSQKVCEEVELISCNFYNPPAMSRYTECFQDALDKKINIVNLSATGKSFNPLEYDLISKLNEAKIPFVTAVGNESDNLLVTPYFPAMLSQIERFSVYAKKNLPNVIAVGALLSNGTRWVGSNYGPNLVWKKGTNVLSALPGNKVGVMTGTSQAAALATHDLLIKLCEGRNHVVKIQSGRSR